MPAIDEGSCPCSLNAASMTEISVAVVSNLLSCGGQRKHRDRWRGREDGPSKGTPVVDDQTGANDVRTSVHRSSLRMPSTLSAALTTRQC